MENENNYLARVGARLLSVANDLKRTPDIIADELGQPRDFISKAVQGKVSLDEMHSLVLQIYKTYPVSMTELWVDRDETNNGVAVMRANQSEASARVIPRKDGHGVEAPYYEYRDTAMVKDGPYKPEWIKELKVVADSDPDNPDVVYNKGHLMHQQTFFIGEVNFYWTMDGKNYCREMNTGDSNYITPYVPHSFTSRNPDQPGLIIAVTFANSIEHARSSMLYVDEKDMDTWFGDTRTPAQMFAQTLQRHRENEMLSTDQLADRLRHLGINTAGTLAKGDSPSQPTRVEIEALATALNVYPEELSFPTLEPEQEVVLCHRSDSEVRSYGDVERPSYLFRDMARSRHLPGLKGFDLEVIADHANPAEIQHGMHEYIYNYGDSAVSIEYGDQHSDTISAGDSAYVSPRVAHKFHATEQNSHLVVVRVAGGMTKDTIQEIASYSPTGRTRAKAEITQWF